MGDCYFKSIYYQHRGETINKPVEHDMIIRSEDLGSIILGENEYGINPERTKLQRTINSTCGIFYYESNLWDIPELKKRLHELVDKI